MKYPDLEDQGIFNHYRLVPNRRYIKHLFEWSVCQGFSM